MIKTFERPFCLKYFSIFLKLTEITYQEVNVQATKTIQHKLLRGKGKRKGSLTMFGNY